jgi:hypothetical protein
VEDPKNAGVFEKAHGDLPDEVAFESEKQNNAVKRKPKRAKTSGQNRESLKEYNQILKSGVEAQQRH